jgi:Flp pilus assembly protein TadD
LPATNSDESLGKLAARFQVNQTDVENGLALYRAQLKQGQNDAALVTLQKLSAVEGSPKYLSYLEAQLWAQNGQWNRAWEAVARFEFGGR